MDRKIVESKIFEIPEKIKEIENAILNLGVGIRELELINELIEDDVKKEVYYDDQYKNAEQRNVAIREKLNNSNEYLRNNNELKARKDRVKVLEVDLKFYYNTFSAFKYYIKLTAGEKDE